MNYEIKYIDHFINNFCTCSRPKTTENDICEKCDKKQPTKSVLDHIGRNIRETAERIRKDRDLSFKVEEEPRYDNVGEIHLGGAQRDQIYSDPDRNIILTLDHQRSPQRRRRENPAPEENPKENPEVNPEDNPPYLGEQPPFVENLLQPNLGQEEELNPLVNLDLDDLEMENAARGLRDSIMGLNQERFSGTKGEDPETFFVRIERHANFSGWKMEPRTETTCCFLGAQGYRKRLRRDLA